MIKRLRHAVKPLKFSAPWSRPLISCDIIAWHRAIAETESALLTGLVVDDLNPLPRITWCLDVPAPGPRKDGARQVVQCRAIPSLLHGTVCVQAVRPGDPPFDDPHSHAREHDRHGRRVRPPTDWLGPVGVSPSIAWPQILRCARILILGGLLAITACAAGADETPGDAVAFDAAVVALDAGPDAALDAGPDAAPGGLGLDAVCDPTLDECASGLTCRPDGKLRGHCRPVGVLPAGAACQAESDCGYAMTWFSDDAGVARCAVICHTAAPQPRCKPNQPCLALVGHLGICAP